MTAIAARLDAEWEAAKADLVRMVHRAQPAFTPSVSSASSQQEVPHMSGLDKLKHILAVADEDAIDVIDTVLAHPEGLAALKTVAAMANIAFPVGTITSALSTADLVLKLYAQQPSAQQAAQQPQQAAQASAQQQPQAQAAAARTVVQ